MSGPRLLLTLYSANPLAQSIPLNGFKYAHFLNNVADIKVIAHYRDRERLSETEFADKIHYAGNKRLADVMRKIGVKLFPGKWNLISLFDFWDYLFFDYDCLKVAKRLNKEYKFDAIMRLTPTTPTWPSVIYKAGLPVITGPHNGGMHWPPAFSQLASKEGTTDFLRLFGKFMHFIYRDVKKYSRILCANKQTIESFGKGCEQKITEISENGVDHVYAQGQNCGDATNLVFIGRLISCRCLDLLLKAMARLPEKVKLTIIGDGPLRGELEQLSASLGLQNRVTFTGNVKQKETVAYLENAGVFVFPSVRDSGGLAVLEAMSHGLPVIVTKWGGPYQYVGDDRYGISLPVGSARELEDSLVASIEKLLENPEYGRDLGCKAKEVIEKEFLWESKARVFLEIVKNVLQTSAEKPETA